MITTDYTSASNPDSLKSGPLQSYRLVHWLRDILKNFCSDPINLKDERLRGLLRMQDEANEARLNALFRVGLPFSGKAIVKAGLTPVMLISAGDTSDPVASNKVLGCENMQSVAGGVVRYHGVRHRSVKLQVAVVTESYDGTLLLCNLIEDFLVMNERNFVKDCGMISEFNVLGSMGPQELQADSAGNAYPLYQAVISISVLGGISWVSDTQGPVFRGISIAEAAEG